MVREGEGGREGEGEGEGGGAGKQFNYEPAAPGHSGTRVYTPGCDCVFCGRVARKSALWLHTRLTKRAANTSATLQRETDRATQIAQLWLWLAYRDL